MARRPRYPILQSTISFSSLLSIAGTPSAPASIYLVVNPKAAASKPTTCQPRSSCSSRPNKLRRSPSTTPERAQYTPTTQQRQQRSTGTGNARLLSPCSCSVSHRTSVVVYGHAKQQPRGGSVLTLDRGGDWDPVQHACVLAYSKSTGLASRKGEIAYARGRVMRGVCTEESIRRCGRMVLIVTLLIRQVLFVRRGSR